MENIELGEEQIKVMRILWKIKRATAQEITSQLNEYGAISLVSVQMLLKKLVKKNVVSYDVDNRTYIYYPLVAEDQVTRHAVNKFINHIFAGSREDLVSYLVRNEYISTEDISDLSKLIDDGEE